MKKLAYISQQLRKIAVDKTPVKDVSSTAPISKGQEKKQDTISLLKSCSDDYVLLMRTIDDNDDLKQNIMSLYPMIHKFSSKLMDVHNGLQKVLNSGEQTGGSEITDFTESLKVTSNEMKPYIALAELLKNLTMRGSAEIEKEKKHKPVEHKVPGKKEKLEPNKKEEKREKA